MKKKRKSKQISCLTNQWSHSATEGFLRERLSGSIKSTRYLVFSIKKLCCCSFLICADIKFTILQKKTRLINWLLQVFFIFWWSNEGETLSNKNKNLNAVKEVAKCYNNYPWQKKPIHRTNCSPIIISVKVDSGSTFSVNRGAKRRCRVDIVWPGWTWIPSQLHWKLTT